MTTSTIIRGNPGDTRRDVFATLTLLTTREFNRTYEVAAWRTAIRVDAGTYDVSTNGYWVLITLPGIIVSEYTPSLYGGVPITSQRPQGTAHENVGRSADHSIQTYLYATLDAIDNGAEFCGGTLTLADGYGITSREVDSFCRPGTLVTMRDLVKL